MNPPRMVASWFGDEQYARMGRVLEHTARRHCPGWVIDVHEAWPAEHEASAYAKPSHQTNTQKMEVWAEAVDCAQDGDRLLLIDADTFITNPLGDIWEDDFDLAHTVKPHSRFPFNSGVVFLRVNEATRRFVRYWWEVNKRMLADAQVHRAWNRLYGGVNQAALGYVMANPQDDQITPRGIPCEVWNCEDAHWASFDPRRTRVVHVKSALRRALFDPYVPAPPHVRALADLWRRTESEMMEAAA